MHGALQIIGVPRGATAEVLRDAYRALARLVHPDKVTASPDAATLTPDATKAFREVYHKHSRM